MSDRFTDEDSHDDGYQPVALKPYDRDECCGGAQCTIDVEPGLAATITGTIVAIAIGTSIGLLLLAATSRLALWILDVNV